MRSQRSELQKLNAGGLKRIEAHREEIHEWERKCEQTKWPLPVNAMQHEQRKTWLRGMYRDNKPWDWMDNG